MPKNRTLIGVLTPSSNTVLEPLTSAIVADLPDVSAHFGRFTVTRIAMDEGSQSQFDLENPLAAARLLADARVDAIVWSGTSASWLGFDRDRQLCERITAETGIPSGSAVLAINELFAAVGAETFGLVSPYVDDVQERIVANYANHGIRCVAERHLNETVNYAFAEFDEQTIADQIRAVAKARPDAITVMCTNMRGARIVPQLEQELAIPIFDSTAAAVWTGMRLAGDNPERIQNWGRLFGM